MNNSIPPPDAIKLSWPETSTPPPPPTTNVLAIAALVTGATIGLVPGLGMIPLILGLFGYQRAKQWRGAGAKMALAGIVLGGLSVVVSLTFVALALLP